MIMEKNKYQNDWTDREDMSEDDCIAEGCAQMVLYAVAMTLALVICILIGGCTTTKYVTVPEYHTDTLRISRDIRDSIWLHDSIYLHEYQRGDTVFVDHDRWHTRYIDRILCDTTYIATHDTIPQPYPVEVTKEVEKRLTLWQRIRMSIGSIVIYILLVVFIVLIVKKRIS